MKNKLFKNILAILMITILISTDFFVLGSNIISYATEELDNSATNNKNIKFFTYFKNEKGEKVEKLQTSINAKDLKLYAEIAVENEGYLSNAVLELQNSNFKIKDNILSNVIASIDGNKIKLKQINAGNTEIIELDIEPIIGDTLTSDMLIKSSDLKLTGTYMETSYKGLKIDATKQVSLNLQEAQDTTAELTTEIITNKIFSIKGENKRVVQALVKSRLADNEYPIKETIINVDVPTLSEKQPEKVEVISLGTMATNGKTSLTADEWKNEDGEIEIVLKNEDSTIKWNKNAYDELVVTLIYEESVDASKVEINANSKIIVHNSEKTYTAKYTKGIENQEPNGVITTQSKINSSGIYKGQIASNINAQYNTTTILKITNTEIPEIITIKETPDVLVLENTEMPINTKYISTKINKAKVLEILGQDGNIVIENGIETILINKDSEVDKDGNVVINYQNFSSELTIRTSQPQKAGILEISHEKAITENTYSMEQLNMVKTLKTKNTITGIITVNKQEQIIVENSSESNIEVKDTISKAEFTVSRDALSTMTVNKDVVLGVKLITNGVQYDLYKNPTVKIQLPECVEKVDINGVKPLYADNFAVNYIYNETNKTIEITLEGEQTTHSETEATQLYLQLNLDITLSKLTPSIKDKIIMTYTNENATQYDNGAIENGVIEKEIEISAPSGMTTMYNSNTYNITGIKGIDEEKQLIQISNAEQGKEVEFNMAVVNNTGEEAKNVKIFGKLPTKGNKITGENEENTLETVLKSITAQTADIYYSENANATTDIENVENGWTTNIIPNAKVFLIKLDSLDVGNSYTATYDIQLPTTLPKDVMSYTEYEITYDTNSDKNIKTKSIAIGFATPTEIKLETSISAQVGKDIINSGDEVKVGEVIKYTITAKNNGAQKLENIELKSSIPDGTVYVTPEENYQHSGTTYYTENTEMIEVKTTIPSLSVGEIYTTTYEVRVKSDITEEKQISNKAIAICNDTNIESPELITKIIPSNIRVTIKKIVEQGNKIVSGGTMEYMVIVDNLSNQDITNLQLQLISENFKTTCLSSGFDLYLFDDEIPEIVDIDKISANGNIWFKIEGDTTENSSKVSAMAVVKDSNENTYRSNFLEEALEKVDAKISLTSPQDKAYIKEGDIIEYNIEVENTGDIEEVIEIVDNVSEYLEIQEVYENGQIVLQSTETAKTDTYVEEIINDFSYNIDVQVGSKATIKIVAIVKNVTENIDAKTITNKAEARLYEMTKATSEEVTHILRITSENIKNVINGKAWLDTNRNGAKDIDETILSGIKVMLYNVSTNDYLKNDNGEIVEAVTNENGEYTFTKIPEGQYIVLFEYDTNEYEPTYYMKDGVDDSISSKVVLKNISINGEDKTYAVTDTINLEDSISNINIGLKEKLNFDLQLNKYISKISVQNSNGTKTYEYGDSTFEKVEIHRKQFVGSVVVLEYTIKVKNNGEIVGYASNIIDYLSNGLVFSSELNPDWYLSGSELYTKKLASEPINPGEEKEVKLVLTKTMTNDNAGVVNNRAEIAEDYNEYGNADINSTPNNNISGENDMGSADVIIGISTGGSMIAYIILVIINTILIAIAIRLMIKNKIITIKKERR